MTQTGSSVRVVDAVTQDWPEGMAAYRRDEASLLACYSGKVGKVEAIDGCEEMPFTVRFSDGSRVPLLTMRFRSEELGDA